MGFKFGQLLMLVAILTCFADGTRAAQASGESEDDSELLPAGFVAWVTALEADIEPRTSWEFPFGSPSPVDMNSEELNTVLSLRRLVLNGNDEDLGALADQVERRQEELPVQMLFWLAYAQGRLNLNRACLSNLQILLTVQEGWKYLDRGQQVWALTGTPDLLFLLGERELAAVFYTRLAASPVEQLKLWGLYQMAGMDFLNRDFKQANLKYSAVCETDKPGLWLEQACEMAKIAERLSRLERERKPHGAMASINP